MMFLHNFCEFVCAIFDVIFCVINKKVSILCNQQYELSLRRGR